MSANYLDDLKNEISVFGDQFVNDFETYIEGKPAPVQQSISDVMLMGQLLATCNPPLNEVMLPDDAISFDGCYIQTPREREIILPPPPAPNLEDIGDKALQSALTVINGAELCMKQISTLTSKMGDDVKLLTEMNKSIIKLQELIDCVEPIKRYHTTRYYLLTDGMQDMASKLTKINPIDVAIQIPLFILEFAKVKIDIPKWANKLNISIDFLLTGNIPFTTEVGMKLIDDTVKNTTLTQKDAFSPSPALGLSLYELKNDDSQGGIMYDTYYNLLSDPINNFFTLQERGLTLDPNGIDKSLIKSANESADAVTKRVKPTYEPAPPTTKSTTDKNKLINSMTTVKIGDTEYYIADKKTYDAFYSADLMNKVNTRLVQRRSLMLTSTDATSLYSEMSELAKMEAQFRWRLDRYSDAVSQSKQFLDWYDSIVVEMTRLNNLKKSINDKMQPDAIIARMKAETTCIQDQPPAKEPEKTINLVDSMTYTDIRNPNITKHCYWVEFCKIATVFGLTPMIDLYTTDQPSLRYWPTGLVIPTPAGLVKIPLPIIWMPLVVVSGSFGIFVLLLGICGVVPSPFVLMIDNSGSKKFLFSLNHIVNASKSQEPFGSNTSDTKTNIFGKTVKKYPPVKSWAYMSLDAFAANVKDKLERDAYGNTMSKANQIIDVLFSKILQDIQALPLPDLIDYRTAKYMLMDQAKKLAPNEYDAVIAMSPANIASLLNSVRADLGAYIEKYLQFPAWPFPVDPLALDAVELTDVTLKEMSRLLDKNLSNPNYTFSQLFNFAMNKVNGQILNYFPGISSINFSISQEFAMVENAIYGTVNSAFSAILNDTLFLNVPTPTVSFSAYKCKSEVGLPANIAFNIKEAFISGLRDTIVNKIKSSISADDIVRFLGFNNISTASLPSAISQYILSKITENPDISLLLNNAATAMTSMYASVAPLVTNALSLTDMLRMIGINQSALLSKAGLDVNLAFIRSGLRSMIDSAFENSVGAFMASIPDYEKHLAELTPIMVKQALITFVVDQRDSIKSMLGPLADTVRIATMFTIPGFSINAFDMLDILNFPKLLDRLLKIVSGALEQTMMPNQQLMDDMMKSLNSMPTIPYIAVQAVQAFTPPDILDKLEEFELHPIRILHPVLNYDDLPPWERLDYSNFLFMVFLDQFCHKAKQTGGMTFLFGEKFGI